MKIFRILIVFSLFSTNVLFAQKSNILSYLPSNYVKTGNVDYTRYIQKCINENNSVVFPDFPLMINDKGLLLRSNQKLVFLQGSQLILKSTNKGSYSMIFLNGVENVVIQGPKLVGDRVTHKGTQGEWGMGIKINNSKGVKIYDVNISRCWGDGIYISGNQTDDIQVFDGFLNSNRRNGISIVSGQNIHLKNLSIENTNGAWPMAAIDIEPNSYEKDFLNNILLENIVTKNNTQGISIVLANYVSHLARTVNIKTVNHKSINDNFGVKISSFVNKKRSGKSSRLNGKIEFENSTISGSKRQPLLVSGKSDEYNLAPNLVFTNLIVDKQSVINTQFKSLNRNRFYLHN